MYSIVFIAIYLLCSSPLQKCVLTLDDVMLQVQRIYVNRRSMGGGAGVKSRPTLQDLFTHKMKSYYATFEGLYRSTGRPDARRVEPLMILAEAERGPPFDLRATLA